MNRVRLEFAGEERQKSELGQKPAARLCRQINLREVGPESAGQTVDSGEIRVDEGRRRREQCFDAEILIVNGAEEQLRRPSKRRRRVRRKFWVVRGLPQNDVVARYR